MLPETEHHLTRMDTSLSSFNLKLKSLYVTYESEFGVSAYGRRRDEALNNLVDCLSDCFSGDSSFGIGVTERWPVRCAG